MYCISSILLHSIEIETTMREETTSKFCSQMNNMKNNIKYSR